MIFTILKIIVVCWGRFALNSLCRPIYKLIWAFRRIFIIIYAAHIQIYLIIIFSIINVNYKTANFHYEKFYFFILKDLILAKVPDVACGNLETLEKIILNQWFPYKISAIFVELLDQLYLKYINTNICLWVKV